MNTKFAYGIIPKEDIASKTGLEILRGMINKEIPLSTIFRQMNMLITEANEGHVLFEATPDENLLNPLGGVHGGWALTIIDSVTGCAAHSTLPPNTLYTSVETKSNFCRPISIDTGTVIAEGKVLSRGKKIITTEGKIMTKDGKLLAHGTSTIIIL